MANPLKVISIEPKVADARRLARCLCDLKEYEVSFVRIAAPAEALGRIAEAQNELLFIDYDLPIVTGLEVIDAARAAGEHRPIIATAAEDSGYLAADLIRAGADGYLAKQDICADFVGPLVSNALKRAQQRTAQVKIQREATREMLRSRQDKLELV